MKSNGEILYLIEVALLKRPLNDREKLLQERESQQRERLEMINKMKLAMMESEHRERIRMINLGILWV